ncbi:MAG TPA: methyltransferase [Pseudonocardia sp.]
MLLCPPGVYRAQSDTAMLTRSATAGEYVCERDVLDMCTGSGAVALAAWRAGAASVTAVDLSWRSVATTWLNSRVRGAPVDVRRGDMFAPVAGRRFGLILSNPPYVPAARSVPPRHRKGRCWDAGLDGRLLLNRICDAAGAHLTDDGTLLMVHSSVCGAEQTVARLARSGLQAQVRERARLPFGPVMRARAGLLVERGLIEPGESVEELVVIEAHRAC